MQAGASSKLASLYVGRAIMLTPTYVSENAPRATRGMLVGLYQLFETMGAMIAFWINYGSLLHGHGDSQWQVPLAMQCLPASLLFTSMLFCNESPRWLARTDRWEKSADVLSYVRHLPKEHQYVQAEILEMKRQLEEELRRVSMVGRVLYLS